MLINSLTKRERRLAIATISIIAIVAIYVVMIRPISSRWLGLNGQIRSKLRTLEKDLRALANQKAVETESATLAKSAKSSKNEEQASADMLAYVENISREDSCFIVNIKPAGISNEESYKEILVEVTAEANIQQFSKFLYDIENPREALVNIKSFSIGSKSGQASGTLRGTFLIGKILLN